MIKVKAIISVLNEDDSLSKIELVDIDTNALICNFIIDNKNFFVSPSDYGYILENLELVVDEVELKSNDY